MCKTRKPQTYTDGDNIWAELRNQISWCFHDSSQHGKEERGKQVQGPCPPSSPRPLVCFMSWRNRRSFPRSCSLISRSWSSAGLASSVSHSTPCFIRGVWIPLVSGGTEGFWWELVQTQVWWYYQKTTDIVTCCWQNKGLHAGRRGWEE